MLSKPTVFIVGAGASFDAGGPYERGGFPMASDLAVAIARTSKISAYRGERVIEDEELHNDIQRQNFSTDDRKARLEALDAISRGLLPTSSIDAFIFQHGQNRLIEEMGKVQIARHIVRAEENSHLFIRGWPANGVPFAEKLGNTWYSRFASMLTDQVPRELIGSIGDHLTIICFNYDRCLEMALIEAFRANYLLDYTKAIEIVGNLNIIHPYGSLGLLSASPDVPGTINFGDVSANPWQMAKSLRTYAEGAKEDGAQDRARAAIKNAQTIVFLGFAFAAQNMKFMTVQGPINVRKRVYATGVGIKPQSLPDLRRRIAAMYGGQQFHINSEVDWRLEAETNCLDLLAMHDRSF